MKRLFTGVLIVFMAASARATLIYSLDDFTSGPIIPALSTPLGTVGDPLPNPLPGGYSDPMAAPQAWGGSRTWHMGVTSVGSPVDFSSFAILGGAAGYSNSSGLQGLLQFGYGNFAGAGDQNQDWTGITGMLINAISVDTGTGSAIIDIASSTGGGVFTIAPLPILGPTINSQYMIPFLSVPAAYLGDVDGVRFTFTTTTAGWDITLGNGGLALTPEPTTLTLLGLGALALVRRRRQRK